MCSLNICVSACSVNVWDTNSLSAFIPVFVLSSHSRFCGCLLMYLDFMLPDHHSLSLPAGLNLFFLKYHCYLQD